MRPPDVVHWMVSNNFGDAMVPWMVRKLTGALPIWAAAADAQAILGGSMANHAMEGTQVWGAGIASMADEINPKADIRAVRGPITRLRALASGAACPEIYGDSAMVLPQLLDARPNPLHPLGVVPHYVDQLRVRVWARSNPDAVVINVFDPVEMVILKILACERIVSSSLHGLVVAHAFGIPAVWAKISDSVGGDDTKFRDHLMSLKMKVYPTVDLRNGIWPAADLIDLASRKLAIPPVCFESDRLLEAFPLERAN